MGTWLKSCWWPFCFFTAEANRMQRMCCSRFSHGWAPELHVRHENHTVRRSPAYVGAWRLHSPPRMIAKFHEGLMNLDAHQTNEEYLIAFAQYFVWGVPVGTTTVGRGNCASEPPHPSKQQRHHQPLRTQSSNETLCEL